MSDAQLRAVFHSFATFGNRLADGASIDNAAFAKMTRDSGILEGLLNATQVDLVFARVKQKGERRIKFPEFLAAVEEMARIKYGNDDRGVLSLREAIVAAGGPLLESVHLPRTVGVFDKLTDVRTFTGTHKERFDDEGRGRGKEGRVDAGAVELSELVRPEHRGGTLLASASANRKRLMESGAMMSPGGGSARGGSSRAESYAGSAAPGSSVASVAGGPAADPSLSDSAAYSGRVSTLANLLATAAPIAFPVSSPAGGGRGGSASSSKAGTGTIKRTPSGGEPGRAAGPHVVIESLELEAVFRAYCAFGTTVRLVEELDSARFAKLCRESGVIDGKLVSLPSTDLAFQKVKARGKRTINYTEFQQALAILSTARYPELSMVEALQSLVERIIASGGPAVSSVALPSVSPDSIFGKLTSPALYTGSHRERFDLETGEGRGLDE